MAKKNNVELPQDENIEEVSNQESQNPKKKRGVLIVGMTQYAHVDDAKEYNAIPLDEKAIAFIETHYPNQKEELYKIING